ncbi:JHY protein, partial [Alcedo cyanopectus]|nr:JHY protein [Ceyx cyanopectus]
DLKLGGLGPNYETIKEKKEKLKQQQEHAKQVKAQNMRSTPGIQRFPTKPQVISSISRLKALEHAKKLLRPKTSPERQLDREMREKRVLPQTLKGESLPQIASSETLQSRHEKEKQIVDAFRTLHL